VTPGARCYVVRGRVQGVGFRFFVQRCAEELGLGGWVRNREDGSVEAAAWGAAAALTRFEEELRRGPRLSRVTSVEVREDEPGPAEQFEIRF
jgi:acylphosphatase